jgi:hypothetical protein
VTDDDYDDEIQAIVLKSASEQLIPRKVKTAKHSKMLSLFMKYFPQEWASSTSCTYEKNIANTTSVSKSLQKASHDMCFYGENESHNVKFTRNIVVKGVPISIQNYKIMFSSLFF